MNKLESVKKIWSQAIKENEENNFISELEINKKLLNFFQVGDYFYLIHHVPTSTFEMISPSIEKILGYPAEEFNAEKIISSIHPDDFAFFIDSENTILDFCNKLPPEKFPKYKARKDYRLRKADGTYLRFLQQALCIQHTDEGGMIRVLLIFTDITDLKTSNKSSLSLIGLEGEPSYIDLPILKNEYYKTKELLTYREKEILNHLINGDTSQEIAEVMHISLHTVQTHRKNILKKTECQSTSELVKKSIERGWI